MAEEASDNLYVAGLPAGVAEDKVKEIFAACGTVSTVRVIAKDNTCSALVRVASVEQARLIIEKINGTTPSGLSAAITVKFADTPDSRAAKRQRVDREWHPQTEPSDKVFVGGLPADLDIGIIKLIFEKHGTVEHVEVVGDKTSAGVVFANTEEASRAVQALSGSVPPGSGLQSPISVQFASGPGAPMLGMMPIIVNGFVKSGVLPGGRGIRSWGFSVYVAGLPTDTDDTHLYKLFSPLGPIGPKGVHTMANEDGACKGIAFVTFLTKDAMDLAIETYNGCILPDGSMLKVTQKKEKPKKEEEEKAPET